MSVTSTAGDLMPALQTFSIVAAALAAGINLGTTIVTLPALLHASPATLATQWQLLYDHGITPVVSLAMSSAAGFATLAYWTTLTPGLTSTGDISHTKTNLYITAAVMAFGLAPYTRILMNETNLALMKRAKSAGKGESVDTHKLVRKWGRFVLGRGLLLLSSAVLGLWASVS